MERSHSDMEIVHDEVVHSQQQHMYYGGGSSSASSGSSSSLPISTTSTAANPSQTSNPNLPQHQPQSLTSSASLTASQRTRSITSSGSSSNFAAYFGFSRKKTHKRSYSDEKWGPDSDEDEKPKEKVKKTTLAAALGSTASVGTAVASADGTIATATAGSINGGVGDEDDMLQKVPESSWLRQQNHKNKRMHICICSSVVVCFLIMGTILGFVINAQIHKTDQLPDTASSDDMGLSYNNQLNPNGHGHAYDKVESLQGVNNTITPNVNFSKVFYGMDYTPAGSQEPYCKSTLANIVEDVKLLSQLTNRIRLYGMGCRQAELVMKAIQYLNLKDMKVVLTLWVDSSHTTWQKEQKTFWELLDGTPVQTDGEVYGKQKPGQDAVRENGGEHVILQPEWVSNMISGVSVGNEVLFRNEDPNRKPADKVALETLDSYIADIRAGLQARSQASTDPIASRSSTSRTKLGQLPVFSSDLGRNAHQLVDQVDWVMSNIHPFFAYQSPTTAASWAFGNFKDETKAAAGSKTAAISEVGWPSGPETANLGDAVPSVANLQTFLDTWVCQANQAKIPYYYFEAFDEPWKTTINPREAQWGIMTSDRKLKVTIPTCQN